MSLRSPEAKEVVLKSIDELIRFAQYVKTFVQAGPIGANQLARLSSAIPDFEQHIIHVLGDLHHPSSGDLPRAAAAAPPAAKVTGKQSRKPAAKPAFAAALPAASIWSPGHPATCPSPLRHLHIFSVPEWRDIDCDWSSHFI
jgi:hypothetical protein